MPLFAARPAPPSCSLSAASHKKKKTSLLTLSPRNAPHLSTPANNKNKTAYEELKPYAGQWDIAVAASPATGAPFAPVACTAPTGCPPALNADLGSALRFTLTRKAGPNKTADGEMATLAGTAPVLLMLRGCFSRPSTVDRPWRRTAPIIDKDRSCPAALAPPRALTAAETAVGAPPLVFEFAIPKNAPKATWFASALFECADKAQCAYETTNGTAFWQTEAVQSKPASLIAAAAVCSTIGPAILAAFFVKDHVVGRKKQ